MKQNSWLSLTGLLVLMLSTTNCAKTGFSGSGSSSVAAKSSTGNDLELADDGDDDIYKDDDDDDDDKDEHHGNCDKDNKKDEPKTESSGDYVACFLGANKSLKLGLSYGQLAWVTGVSNSICIPKEVCLVGIKEFAGVTTSADKSYCDKNKNVLRLSASQIEQLL